MKECCKDSRNLRLNPPHDYVTCIVCGAKHYELIAEPIIVKGKF